MKKIIQRARAHGGSGAPLSRKELDNEINNARCRYGTIGGPAAPPPLRRPADAGSRWRIFFSAPMGGGFRYMQSATPLYLAPSFFRPFRPFCRSLGVAKPPRRRLQMVSGFAYFDGRPCLSAPRDIAAEKGTIRPGAPASPMQNQCAKRRYPYVWKSRRVYAD